MFKFIIKIPYLPSIIWYFNYQPYLDYNFSMSILLPYAVFKM